LQQLPTSFECSAFLKKISPISY